MQAPTASAGSAVGGAIWTARVATTSRSAATAPDCTYLVSVGAIQSAA